MLNSVSDHNDEMSFRIFTDAFANNRKTESHTGDEVTCVANASKQLSCLYQWYKSNSTAEVPYEVPKPSGPGLYTCQAQCLIRNYICNFTAMVINVSVVHAPGNTELWSLCLQSFNVCR